MDYPSHATGPSKAREQFPRWRSATGKQVPHDVTDGSQGESVAGNVAAGFGGPMKRKRSHARLREVATLLAQIPTYKTLARETGYCESYCRAVVSSIVREIKIHTDVLIHVEQSKSHECASVNLPSTPHNRES